MVSATNELQTVELKERREDETASEAPVEIVGSKLLYRNSLRLDAGYYNAETMQAYRTMVESGLVMRRLGDVTGQIFIPPRFKRVYVDESHGVPFLQGRNIPQLRPADLQYLSRSAHKNLDQWIIKAGWVLVTCSGTIGRIAIASEQWDGWAASQHILRVVPNPDNPCPAGYIYAWLSSPLGRAQFNGTYGAVVKELTAAHVSDILIPVPETEKEIEAVNSINALAIESIVAKERALEQDKLATEAVESLMASRTP